MINANPLSSSRIKLRRVTIMEEGVTTVGSQGRLASWSEHHPLRILVVDDYPDNADSLGLLLALYGYQVETALSGCAALAKARMTKPDVAILDISMPVMDGCEVARQLRKMYHDEIILIAMTANGSQEDRRKSHEAGFNMHLVKPADPQKLEGILKSLAAQLEEMTSAARLPETTSR